MSFTVHGVDVANVYVGATQASKVYVGTEQVWPGATPPGDLRSLILAHNPLHYWVGDDASGSLADSGSDPIPMAVISGNAPLYQQPIGTKGMVGFCSDLNGNTRLQATSPNLPASCTLLVVGVGDAPDSRGPRTTQGDWNNFALLWRNHGSNVEAYVRGDGLGDNIIATAPVTWTDPYLLALVIDGTTVTAYGNGVAGTPQTITGAWRGATSSSWYLLNRGSNNGAWERPIAHCAVIPSVLTGTEILDLYTKFAQEV